MVNLALRLKIFIVSPSDVAEERDIAEKVIGELPDNRRMAKRLRNWRRGRQLGQGPESGFA